MKENKKENEMQDLFKNLDEKNKDILGMVAKGMLISQSENKEEK